MSAEGLVYLAGEAYQYVVTADEGSVDLALREVHAVDKGASVAQEFVPGVLLVNGVKSFAEVAAAWSTQPPIFVRHVNPVQSVLTVAADAAWEGALELAAIAEILPYLEATLPFSVQSRVFPPVPLRPFAVNQLLAEVGTTQFGLQLDIREPEQVVSVLVRAEVAGATTFYLGASLVQANLSDWAGGMRRFARDEGQISRSEFKLLEALEVFAPPIPARGTALDLGAAPGGWTRVLRQLEQYVTAVDPGELDPRLATDRGVRHRRMTAEEYLAAGPDEFDVIVNDMRMDARDSARLMVRYAKFLYPHGWAVMTVKLPEQKRQPILDHAFAILREAYTIAGARQLFHNRSEITVLLLPRRT